MVSYFIRFVNHFPEKSTEKIKKTVPVVRQEKTVPSYRILF